MDYSENDLSIVPAVNWTSSDQSIPINDKILSIKYENDLSLKFYQNEHLKYLNNFESDINQEKISALSTPCSTEVRENYLC